VETQAIIERLEELKRQGEIKDFQIEGDTVRVSYVPLPSVQHITFYYHLSEEFVPVNEAWEQRWRKR